MSESVIWAGNGCAVCNADAGDPHDPTCSLYQQSAPAPDILDVLQGSLRPVDTDGALAGAEGADPGSQTPASLPPPPPKATPLHASEVYLYDETDRRRFADFLNKSKKLDSMLSKLEKDWGDESLPLMQDTWAWFNRGGQIVKNPERQSPGNEEILDGALATGEAQEAARETLEDDVSSAMAVLEMQPVYETVIAKLKKEKKESDDAEQQAEKDEAKAEKNKKRGGSGQAKLDAKAKESREKAAAAGQKLKAAAGEAKKQVRSKMRAACKKAAKNARDAKDTLEGYGMGRDSAGGSKRCSPEDLDKRVGLAQQLANNPAHRRLAELVGKLTRELFHRRASNATAPPQSLNKVGQGSDFGRALPHVLALLQHPLLKYKVLADAADRALPIYTNEEVPEEIKGAVICIRDKSGSMMAQMSSGYTRDEAATAYSLAVMAIAKSESRPFFAIDFSWKQDIRVWTEQELSTPDGVMAFACHGFGGGTAIGAALEQGLELLRANPERLKNADVLLLTDVEGNCEDGPAQKEAVAVGMCALEARLWLYDVGYPGTELHWPDCFEIARKTGGAAFNTEDLLAAESQNAIGQMTDSI